MTCESIFLCGLHNMNLKISSSPALGNKRTVLWSIVKIITRYIYSTNQSNTSGSIGVIEENQILDSINNFPRLWHRLYHHLKNNSSQNKRGASCPGWKWQQHNQSTTKQYYAPTNKLVSHLADDYKRQTTVDPRKGLPIGRHDTVIFANAVKKLPSCRAKGAEH